MFRSQACARAPSCLPASRRPPHLLPARRLGPRRGSSGFAASCFAASGPGSCSTGRRAAAPPRRRSRRAGRPRSSCRIVYLGKEYDEPPPLSYAEQIITDKGIQGARVSIKEANQSGSFVGHAFDLVEAIVPADGDVVAKAKEILKDGDA